MLDFEHVCLQLPRAIRKADFSLYLKAIRAIALDSQNYARWLSVHYGDMCVLPIKHPHAYAEFHYESFVVHKTKRLFLSTGLHHAHEKVNAVVKDERGAVGLIENPATLRRWMVASSELARMVEEFEEVIYANKSQNEYENRPAIQNAFAKDVVNQVSSFEELSCPFKLVGEDLTALNTKHQWKSCVDR